MDRFILRLMVGGIATREEECESNVRGTALKMLERAKELHGVKVESWVSLYVGGFPPGYAGMRSHSKEPDPEWICDFALTQDGKLDAQACGSANGS